MKLILEFFRKQDYDLKLGIRANHVHNATTVCCYNNQVDYFCCLDTTAEECPDYQHVTVVIHNAMPHNPFGMRSYFFRDGIEDEVVDAAIHGPSENINENAIRHEDGFIVRHNDE
ncbi:hypothetical protein TELCIR_15145 [Teladorsagia circumcincta]|uniref:Uncharacterized protein n=1 Tax=Teladorsagia circumcincta TaxID=45464 RepID=A0A2G9TZ45_TELCI|nr:hypothetical protein TELCIR_15145 [Teladorsagia circumcincta]